MVVVSVASLLIHRCRGGVFPGVFSALHNRPDTLSLCFTKQASSHCCYPACHCKEASMVLMVQAAVSGASWTVTLHTKNSYGLRLEYTRSRWSRQRLRLYGGKKRTFSKYFNRIKKDERPGQRTVIAFGASRFQASTRQVAVPSSRSYKEACQRFPTMSVDEFRTTKVHHKTQTIMKRVSTNRQVMSW